MSVMNGFRTELIGKILGLNGHFVVQETGEGFADYNDVVTRIEGVPGVLYAIPYVDGQALASGVSSATGVVGARHRARRRSPRSCRCATARHWAAGTSGMTARASPLASGWPDRLGVTIGDDITIINPNGTPTPFGCTPAERTMPVNVIFDLGAARV